MFSLPAPRGETQDGISDEKPIVLPEEESTDFEMFLSVLYPLCVLADSFIHL
jgi:hypothetical protein